MSEHASTDPAPSTGNTEYPEIRQDLFCQDCGYNLRGLIGNRCPECGGSLDGVRATVPRIPWVHRAEVGRFRAYWRTVWMVMFRQRRFGEEMAREVAFADSQEFRWATVAHLCVTVMLGFIAIYSYGVRSPFKDEFLDGLYNRVWPTGVLAILFALFLAAATGVPSYFFHPRSVPISQQNRAIALSYYACGPLAFLVVPLMTAFASLAAWRMHEAVGMTLLVVSVVLPIGPLAAWWLDLIHLARRLLPQRPFRATAVAVLVPALWLALAGLVFVGIPFFGFLFVVVVVSQA